MKFLCDQCKAKYQISDDKVAGKTVRMKCRKCGHLIEVRAAVTESSVATSLPTEPPAAPGKPSGKPAPPKSPLATSLAQAKPNAPRPGPKPEGGLSSAFKSQMQAREDEAALLELSGADEWYAAINGVPVGPIRIGELRRKASLGAVTEDSLVWQEGMEEWRPVKNIPELAAMLREAATKGPVSLVTPEPPNARQSVLPTAPGRPAPPQRPIPPRPVTEPVRPAATAARSNVVPINSRLATAERLEEDVEAPTSDRHLLLESSEAASDHPPPDAATAASAMAPPTPAPGAIAFSPATGASGLTPMPAAALANPPASQQQAPVIINNKAPPNYIAIGMIAMMAVFGGIGAWAVFLNKPPPPAAPVAPTIVTQYLPAPSAPAAAAAPVESASPEHKRTGAVAAAPKSTGNAPNLKQMAPGLDIGALAPGAGPTGPAPAVPGSGLSSEAVESTVRMHQSAVKRVCWERIGGGGSTSAIEKVHISIDGNGHVSSASADGNNATVGTCLEKEIRGWVFPPSGGTTEVDLPFKFISQ